MSPAQEDPSLMEDELIARSALSAVLERGADFYFNSRASFWAHKGNRMNKEFFLTEGEQVKALRDSTGMV